MSINHPLTNITFARAEPSLDYFQHLKLHAHVFVVFVLSPSPQCQNIGLGGGASIYIYIYIVAIQRSQKKNIDEILSFNHHLLAFFLDPHPSLPASFSSSYPPEV